MNRLYLVRSITEPYPLNKNADTEKSLVNRPTYWGLFFRSLLDLVKGDSAKYNFVRLSSERVEQLLSGRKLGMIKHDVVLINGDIYEVEPWTFMALLEFCIQGLKYGTFQRFTRWRW